MDPNMENYFRMQQSGGYKIPFYMAYPMQDVYLSEIEYERDRERLKEMYPKEAKRIQRVVEEECDKMEYDGSLMFDEYPDKNRMLSITKKIAKNTSSEKSMENMIFQALANEMIHRRRRHRCCKNWNRKCFY